MENKSTLEAGTGPNNVTVNRHIKGSQLNPIKPIFRYLKLHNGNVYDRVSDSIIIRDELFDLLTERL